jgi:transposase
MTHPGRGSAYGTRFRADHWNLGHFPRGKQIATYVGMIPSEDSSAGKQRLGHISKQGNSLLRFLAGGGGPSGGARKPNMA